MTSDDGKIDATTAESVASEVPQEDVAEVSAESIETPEKETKTADTNAISDADLVQIDKFSKLVESERIERIQNLLTSGRKDQVAIAKVLMEAFDLEVEEKSAPNVDEAVAESLRKMGLTPESIKELREKKEDEEKREAVKSWAEQLGLPPSEILKNKDFVKAFHSKDSDDVNGKVDFAIKAYLKNNSVSSQAKQKATLKLSTTGKATATPSAKGRMSIEELLGGKSLDEIDLARF